MDGIDADVGVQCPFCFEQIEVRVDCSGGAQQHYVYDCEVCCHPIELRIKIDADGDIEVSATTES